MNASELNSINRIAARGNFFQGCITSITTALEALDALAADQESYSANGVKITVSITCDQGEGGVVATSFTAPAKINCLQSLITAANTCLSRANTGLNSIKIKYEE